MKNWRDPLEQEYGPKDKPVLKLMIPLHKVWGFFKKKRKKKPVRRDK